LIKGPQIDVAFEFFALPFFGGVPVPQDIQAKRFELKEKLHNFKTKGKGLRGAVMAVGDLPG
jgi:hypothetical protein